MIDDCKVLMILTVTDAPFPLILVDNQFYIGIRPIKLQEDLIPIHKVIVLFDEALHMILPPVLYSPLFQSILY
jgi:hypothetical protein